MHALHFIPKTAFKHIPSHKNLKVLLYITSSLLSFSPSFYAPQIYAASAEIDYLQLHQPHYPGKTFAQTLQCMTFETVAQQTATPSDDDLQILKGNADKNPLAFEAADLFKHYLKIRDNYERVDEDTAQTQLNLDEASKNAMSTLAKNVSEHPGNPYLAFLFLSEFEKNPTLNFHEEGYEIEESIQSVFYALTTNTLYQDLLDQAYLAAHTRAFNAAVDMEKSGLLYNDFKQYHPDKSPAEIAQMVTDATSKIKRPATIEAVKLWAKGCDDAKRTVAYILQLPLKEALSSFLEFADTVNVYTQSINDLLENMETFKKKHMFQNAKSLEDSLKTLTARKLHYEKMMEDSEPALQSALKDYFNNKNVQGLLLKNRYLQTFMFQAILGVGEMSALPKHIQRLILRLIGEMDGVYPFEYFNRSALDEKGTDDQILKNLITARLEGNIDDAVTEASQQKIIKDQDAAKSFATSLYGASILPYFGNAPMLPLSDLVDHIFAVFVEKYKNDKKDAIELWDIFSRGAMDGFTFDTEGFENTIHAKIKEKYDPEYVTSSETWKILNKGRLPHFEDVQQEYDHASIYGFYETMCTALLSNNYYSLFFKDTSLYSTDYFKMREDILTQYTDKLLEEDKLRNSKYGEEFYNSIRVKNYTHMMDMYHSFIQTIQETQRGGFEFDGAMPYYIEDNLSYYTEQYNNTLQNMLTLALGGVKDAQNSVGAYLNTHEPSKDSILNTLELWEDLSQDQRITLTLNMMNATQWMYDTSQRSLA